jgi:hypothetical protein
MASDMFREDLVDDIEFHFRFAHPRDVQAGEYILLRYFPAFDISPKYVPRQVVKATKASIWLEGEDKPHRREKVTCVVDASHEKYVELYKEYQLRYRLREAIVKITKTNSLIYNQLSGEELYRFTKMVEELDAVLAGQAKEKEENDGWLFPRGHKSITPGLKTKELVP